VKIGVIGAFTSIIKYISVVDPYKEDSVLINLLDSWIKSVHCQSREIVLHRAEHAKRKRERFLQIASFNFNVHQEEETPPGAPFELEVPAFNPFVQIEAVDFMSNMFPDRYRHTNLYHISMEEVRLWTLECAPFIKNAQCIPIPIPLCIHVIDKGAL
jgi:hypothetical protein